MNKPPRKWWYSTVDRLKKLPEIHDAKRAAGWLWYHHLTPAQKIKALTKKDLQREMLKYYTSSAGNCTKTGETMGKKTKKRLTEKQRANLAKGRRVLKRIRHGRRISEPKEPILIKEGFLMEGKRGRKKARKHSGIEGISRKRTKSYHTSSPRLHGASEGFNAGHLALDLAGILAGAIGLSAIASMVPVKSLKYKSLIPIVAGIIGLSIPKVSRIRFLNRAALGALSIGGYSLTKQLVPTLPLMGAADTAEGVGNAIMNLPPEEKAILGILPAQLDFQPTLGEVENLSSAPGEMLGDGEMLGTVENLSSVPGEMLGEDDETAGAESDFE